jgi:hypothetical protein
LHFIDNTSNNHFKIFIKSDSEKLLKCIITTMKSLLSHLISNLVPYQPVGDVVQKGPQIL